MVMIACAVFMVKVMAVLVMVMAALATAMAMVFVHPVCSTCASRQTISAQKRPVLFADGRNPQGARGKKMQRLTPTAKGEAGGQRRRRG